MKLSSVLVFFMCVIGLTDMQAQITLETQYFGNSDYKDKDNNKVGNSKGSATVYQGSINLPISAKIDNDSLPRVWGIQASGVYAKFNNENFPTDELLVLSEITNVQFTAFHLRSLNKKWSVLAFAGAGIYTEGKSLSKIKSNTILATGGALFIKKINPNLQIGGGLALNNAFGYPMIFPSIYFDYNYEGQYRFKISMMNGLEATAGYQFNKALVLTLVTEINGQLALIKKDDQDVIFTHQTIIAGIRPEIIINKHITIPITVGISATRSAYFTERKLKSIFDLAQDDSHFQASPYASARLQIQF